jgi:hypothetical protein
VAKNAFAFEPYAQHESFPNVATQGGTGTFGAGAWTFGLKLDFTRVNTPSSRTSRRLQF